MKIKEIKIVNQDESTEVADIGADAINVDYNNTTVKAELDKLNTDINTNKNNITNLQSQVSSLASESLAQLSEIVDARGGFDTLGERLDNSDTVKADKTEVQSADNDLQNQINSLASGSPKGVYATASALKNANPETGVYVVTADGHIYSWTKNGNNAIDLGIYRTSVADKSISLDGEPAESTSVKSALKNLNYLNKSFLTDEDFSISGAIMDGTSITQVEHWYSTNYINIAGYSTFMILTGKNSPGVYVWLYDKDKNLVDFNDGLTSVQRAKAMPDHVFNIPSETVYMRASISKVENQHNIVDFRLNINNIDDALEKNDIGIKYGYDIKETGGIGNAHGVIDNQNTSDYGFTLPNPMDIDGRIESFHCYSNKFFNAQSNYPGQKIYSILIFRYNKYTQNYEVVNKIDKAIDEDFEEIFENVNKGKSDSALTEFNLRHIKINLKKYNLQCKKGDFIGFKWIEDNSSQGSHIRPVFGITNSMTNNYYKGTKRTRNIRTASDNYIYLDEFRNDVVPCFYFTIIPETENVGPRSDEDVIGIVYDEDNISMTYNDTLYSSSKMVYMSCGYNNIDKILNKIYYYSGSNKTVTYAIGQKDQRGWFVASNTGTFNVVQGMNEIDLSSELIVIPAGETVAFSVDTNDEYSQISDVSITQRSWDTFNSISDYETITRLDGIAYIGYSVLDIDVQNEVNNLKTSIGNLSTEIDIVSAYGIKAPNGTPYSLAVDNNGQVYAKSLIVNNYLALGNSITWHPITTNVWYSEWGMAATYEAYDYVHRIATYLSNLNNQFQLRQAVNIASWETSSNRGNLLSSLLDNVLTNDLEFISIQLGENVSNTSTLEEDFEDLIRYIQTKCPRATILLIGQFWASDVKDNAKKLAARNTNVDFVDLSPYYNLEGMQSSLDTVYHKADGTEYTINNSAVARHPSDNGMKMIAEEVLKKLLKDNNISL